MRATVLKLGAFIVVCLLFTGWLAFTIGNIHPFRDTYQLSATFDDVTGLLPDDNVKVAGVVVGKVQGISIERGRARVTFTVENGVRLPSDSEAAIRWRNLLGQRYLYLYPGAAGTVLRDGGRVAHTRSVIDLGELFNRLGPIVQAIDPAQVNTFLDAVVGALDGNQAKLSKALDDLATLAFAVGHRDDAIRRLVQNLDTVAGTIASRDQQIRSVLDNLLALASTFSDNTAVLDQAVTELGDFSDNLQFVLSRNRSEIERLIANLRAVTDVVGAKLPVVESAVGGLDDAALRLFNASRYGEWLNQTIPCGGFFYPHRVDAQDECRPNAGPGATASGAAAVNELLAAGLPATVHPREVAG